MQVKLLISPEHRVILSSKLVRYSRPSIRGWLRQADRAIRLRLTRFPDTDIIEYAFDHPSRTPPVQYRFEATEGDLYLR